jgi:hypothetical protein
MAANVMPLSLYQKLNRPSMILAIEGKSGLDPDSPQRSDIVLR